MEGNYSSLKRLCEDAGADLFGVADINGIKKEFALPREMLEEFDKAVCLGVRLSASVLGEIKEAPTRLYSYHYRTANSLLDQVAFRAGNYIQKKGYSALPIPASQILDWESQKAHLSHKKIGYLAGLGWIGRNNLLVNEELGSQFRLVSILTDMPLRTDKPTKQDCAECRRCIKVCPAGAIKEKASDFNHLKCFEKLKEFNKRRLVEQYICGICVNICKGEKR